MAPARWLFLSTCWHLALADAFGGAVARNLSRSRRWLQKQQGVAQSNNSNKGNGKKSTTKIYEIQKWREKQKQNTEPQPEPEPEPEPELKGKLNGDDDNVAAVIWPTEEAGGGGGGGGGV